MTVHVLEPCPECGRMIDHRTFCRLQDKDGKDYKRCAICCPNCWGGPGKGPVDRALEGTT